MPIIIACTMKRNGKGCAFELLALAPDFETGIIYVYAHSQHNHPLMSEGKMIFPLITIQIFN
jgi:hypothetical protein